MEVSGSGWASEINSREIKTWWNSEASNYSKRNGDPQHLVEALHPGEGNSLKVKGRVSGWCRSLLPADIQPKSRRDLESTQKVSLREVHCNSLEKGPSVWNCTALWFRNPSIFTSFGPCRHATALAGQCLGSRELLEHKPAGRSILWVLMQRKSRGYCPLESMDRGVCPLWCGARIVSCDFAQGPCLKTPGLRKTDPAVPLPPFQHRNWWFCYPLYPWRHWGSAMVEGGEVTFKVKPIELTADFLEETLKARRTW